MKSPLELVQDCRRGWWWSPSPFWKYLDANGQGWANLVDTHPGMFNLAWLLAGVDRPPEGWGAYVETTQWVVINAPRVYVGGKPLLDLAFRLSLPDFKRTANGILQQNLKAHKVRVPKRA